MSIAVQTLTVEAASEEAAKRKALAQFATYTNWVEPWVDKIVEVKAA